MRARTPANMEFLEKEINSLKKENRELKQPLKAPRGEFVAGSNPWGDAPGLASGIGSGPAATIAPPAAAEKVVEKKSPAPKTSEKPIARTYLPASRSTGHVLGTRRTSAAATASAAKSSTASVTRDQRDQVAKAIVRGVTAGSAADAAEKRAGVVKKGKWQDPVEKPAAAGKVPGGKWANQKRIEQELEQERLAIPTPAMMQVE